VSFQDHNVASCDFLGLAGSTEVIPAVIFLPEMAHCTGSASNSMFRTPSRTFAM